MLPSRWVNDCGDEDQDSNVTAESPLSAAVFRNRQHYCLLRQQPIVSGDTILSVDNKPIEMPVMAAALAASSDTKRHGSDLSRGVTTANLKFHEGVSCQGSTPEAQLGSAAWSIGRDLVGFGFLSATT